jgi:hypothetical protein
MMKKLMILNIISLVLLAMSAGAIETTISDGTPGPTTRIAASNTAASLSSSLLTVSGVSTRGAIISVESYGVRVAFGGTTPASGVTGHYIEAGGSIRVYGLTAMQGFKYVNDVSGNNAILQVTPLY